MDRDDRLFNPWKMLVVVAVISLAVVVISDLHFGKVEASFPERTYVRPGGIIEVEWYAGGWSRAYYTQSNALEVIRIVNYLPGGGEYSFTILKAPIPSRITFGTVGVDHPLLHSNCSGLGCILYDMKQANQLIQQGRARTWAATHKYPRT